MKEYQAPKMVMSPIQIKDFMTLSFVNSGVGEMLDWQSGLISGNSIIGE